MCFRPSDVSTLPTKCPKCGEMNDPGVQVCAHCGAELAGSPAPAAPSAPGAPGAPGAPKAPGAPAAPKAPGAPSAPKAPGAK